MGRLKNIGMASEKLYRNTLSHTLIPCTGRTVIPLSPELLGNHDYLLRMRGKLVRLPIDKTSMERSF